MNNLYIKNDNSEILRITIEPVADQYYIDPGSVAMISFKYNKDFGVEVIYHSSSEMDIFCTQMQKFISKTN